jgi:choline dehydrogenase-like flavoprotein
MKIHDYDLIVVGGGLGGAALAKVMASSAARVLVLEREVKFKDEFAVSSLRPGEWSKRDNLASRSTYNDVGASCRISTWEWGRPATWWPQLHRLYRLLVSVIPHCRRRFLRQPYRLGQRSAVGLWSPR